MRAKLTSRPVVPPEVDVPTLLRELEAEYQHVDIVRVLGAVLPTREGIWWACLAGRDIVGVDSKSVPATLATAEAWVFDPKEAHREAARAALDAADTDDPTELCAMAVAMRDGKLGPGKLSDYDAPTGATAMAIFGMNLLACGHNPEAFPTHLQVVIERGLDIARGGDGRIDSTGIEPRMPPDPDADTEDEEEETVQ